MLPPPDTHDGSTSRARQLADGQSGRHATHTARHQLQGASRLWRLPPVALRRLPRRRRADGDRRPAEDVDAVVTRPHEPRVGTVSGVYSRAARRLPRQRVRAEEGLLKRRGSSTVELTLRPVLAQQHDD